MSSPSNLNAPSATAASPSPSSPPETPRPARTFSRAAPADFGARLSNARNLRPHDAPPPPPPQTPFPAFSDDILVHPLVHPAFGPALNYNVGPKFSGIPGGYISPYDSGGKTPGDRHLPANSMTEAEFERKYGSAARRGSDARTNRAVTSAGGVKIAMSEFEAIDNLKRHKMEKLEKEKKAVPEVPEGVRI